MRSLPYLWRHGLSLGALLCTALLLCGCDHGPSDATLGTDIAAYVESGYAPGLMDVVTAERRDRPILPDFGDTARTITFTADLRLKRDYDFGAWDQPNATALLYLLGAHTENLSGIKASGNKSGDVIHVRGALIYARTADHWHLEAGVPPNQIAGSAPSLGRRAALAQWWRITALTFRGLLSSPSTHLTQDLAAAIKSASARLARQGGGITLASGPVGSEYWTMMRALAESESTPAHDPIINLASSGSRESLRLLREDTVTAIVLRADEAVFAANGEGPFDHDGTFPDLRALAGLLPEQIHVAVMASSPVASVADLFGKRVAVAMNAPAAATEAGDVLRAHSVPIAALAAPLSELSTTAALEALARGEQDAVIVTSPAPSPELRNFAVAHPLRLLPLDADAVALLTTGTSSAYVAVTVPAQTYPGQTKPIATVGVVALLVSSTRIPDAETKALLQAAFSDIDFLGHGSAMGTMIKASSARKGITLPLHGGAEAYFGATPGQK